MKTHRVSKFENSETPFTPFTRLQSLQRHNKVKRWINTPIDFIPCLISLDDSKIYELPSRRGTQTSNHPQHRPSSPSFIFRAHRDPSRWARETIECLQRGLQNQYRGAVHERVTELRGDDGPWRSSYVANNRSIMFHRSYRARTRAYSVDSFPFPCQVGRTRCRWSGRVRGRACLPRHPRMPWWDWTLPENPSKYKITKIYSWRRTNRSCRAASFKRGRNLHINNVRESACN